MNTVMRCSGWAANKVTLRMAAEVHFPPCGSRLDLGDRDADMVGAGLQRDLPVEPVPVLPVVMDVVDAQHESPALISLEIEIQVQKRVPAPVEMEILEGHARIAPGPEDHASHLASRERGPAWRRRHQIEPARTRSR